MRVLQLNKLLIKQIQLIKYSIVGILNTIASLIAFYLLLKFNINYIISNSIAYFIGIFNSYILNKIWVFNSKEPIKVTGPKFLVTNIVTLAVSTLLLYLLVEKVNLNKVLSQITVTVIIFAINYSINKLWTFRNKLSQYNL